MTKRLLELPGRIRPYVMAHRGNRSFCPENTLAAFQRAIQEGADILETDLHLTADGVLVCIHDATIDRTTDGTGLVAEKSLEELKQFSAYYGRQEFIQERIPTLDEVIPLLPSDRALALELKTSSFLNPAVARQLVTQLREGGVYERTILLSFHLDYLQSVQREAPDLPIGLISMTNPIPRNDVQLIGVFWPVMLLNPLYVWMAHRNGLATCPLDPAPDKRLGFYKWLGVDAILTDDPGKTIQLLRGKV